MPYFDYVFELCICQSLLNYSLKISVLSHVNYDTIKKERKKLSLLDYVSFRTSNSQFFYVQCLSFCKK